MTSFFVLILRAIGTGDSKGPLIFLRGISYHEIEAVLEFMYNGQTKVQQTELDAFLAAAEELKIKGLTTNPTGNTNDSTTSGGATSRKRPSTHVQHSEDSFDNGNGQQKSSKVKKSRPAPNAIGQAGPSSASDIAGRNNMVVKAEEVNLIDAEDDERFVFTLLFY